MIINEAAYREYQYIKKIQINHFISYIYFVDNIQDELIGIKWKS